MNEFQFYEFQTLDNLLSIEQQTSLSYLSQTSQINDRQAVFTYSYGDLPRQPEDLVARLFDAMLYLSTWGTKQLMFRFPASAIDAKQIEPFLVPHRIDLIEDNAHYILVLNLGEDDSVEWIDGEGELSKVTALRQDIINGDYRSLYLAWLKVIELREVSSTAAEPYIPKGESFLTSPLRHFINLFEIDSSLLAAAARPSENTRTVKELRQIAEQEIVHARQWYINNIATRSIYA
ncbi:MAG: hypothetical protein KDE51_16090 [Anaerolineales bacterium]|nr:hypothetical protein [Anaerolineales bacterium]